MLRRFYYSDLFIDGQEITPYYMPQFYFIPWKVKAISRFSVYLQL